LARIGPGLAGRQRRRVVDVFVDMHEQQHVEPAASGPVDIARLVLDAQHPGNDRMGELVRQHGGEVGQQ